MFHPLLCTSFVIRVENLPVIYFTPDEVQKSEKLCCPGNEANEGKSEPKQKKTSKNLLSDDYAPNPSILNTLIL